MSAAIQVFGFEVETVFDGVRELPEDSASQPSLEENSGSRVRDRWGSGTLTRRSGVPGGPKSVRPAGEPSSFTANSPMEFEEDGGPKTESSTDGDAEFPSEVASADSVELAFHSNGLADRGGDGLRLGVSVDNERESAKSGENPDDG